MNHLGIEIGGTKLQLGIGCGDSANLIAIERRSIDRAQGAIGILEQIDVVVNELIQKHQIDSIGIGFGGPVDATRGIAIVSHQVDGWDNFELPAWCQRQFQTPTVIGNDCDCATLAESRFGAGKNARSVFYVTVGTGIGGGLVIDNQLLGSVGLGGLRPASAEIGHLRPGPQSDRAEMTVESIASGLGITNNARARLGGAVAGSVGGVHNEADDEFASDLLARCNHDLAQLDGKIVAQAAAEGNEIAKHAIDHAISVLGWAIAQVITLVAPEVIVVGGGVSMIGENEFFDPLRREVERYVFPVLKDSFQIVPASLGEEVVVHGAILLAAQNHD